MEGAAPADEFIPAGLASLGIEADEVDLAVMAAVHQILWPPILELLDAAEALERANGRRWVESLPPLAEAEPTEV